MLANLPDALAWCGKLSSDLHRPATFLHELLDFIAEELPRWRDDPDRPVNLSETALTEYLCDRLSSAARKSSGLDMLQFRTEVTDERRKNRKVDLTAKPCGATIWIDARRHTQYDSLLPIECKRLPTPKGTKRDRREYVFNKHGTTGGIQRFKDGNHGAAHNLGAMIGYVQEETADLWDKRIAGWINDLVASGQLGWTKNDLLQLDINDATLRLARLHSVHTREFGLPEIELRHLWVEMN